MNRFILIFIPIIFFVSCSDEPIVNVLISYSIEVSPQTYNFNSSGGEFTFDVISKKITTVTVDGDITDRVSEDIPYDVTVSGEGFSIDKNTNTVTASANNTYNARTGVLLVKITESDYNVKVNLTQDKKIDPVVPLPGNKKNYTVVFGRFAISGRIWAQLSNIEFNPVTGTFHEESWYWDTNLRKGKTAFHTYNGTVGGANGTIYLFTPTGWINPQGQSGLKEGRYFYDAQTGDLEITYSDNRRINWVVESLDEYGGLAQIEFKNSTYDITHGRGYGSNADWNVYKKLNEIPRISYKGYSVLARGKPDDFRNWFLTRVNLKEYHFSEDAKSLRYQQLESSIPGIDETGIVYHYSSYDNSRAMILNHFNGVLAGSAFPSYNRNLHPYAVQQVINDGNELVGFVMVEQQNPPEAMYDGNYQYQIRCVLKEN